MDTLREAAQPRCLPTGIRDLDLALAGGLRAGQLTVLAASPGTGTSTLALTLARETAIRQLRPTLYLAPELHGEELMTRIVSAEAVVAVDKIRSRNLNSDDLARIARVRPAIEQAPLRLWTESLQPSPQQLDDPIDHALSLSPLSMVVVDLQPDNEAVVRGLKMMAQRHHVAVVVCARTAVRGSSPGTVPQSAWDYILTDALLEYSDLILGLHREDMYHTHSTRAGEADVQILKHRYGPTGPAIPLCFQGQYARFVNPAS